MDVVSHIVASMASLVHATVKTILIPLTMLWDIVLGRIHTLRLGSKFPGKPGLPFLGNVLDLGRTSEDLYKNLEDSYYTIGKFFRVYVGPLLVIVTTKVEDNESLLFGHEFIGKGLFYTFMKPWLGDGLLLSKGEKWHTRRKILTPAFHFKILDQFVPVFNNCGEEFIRQMRKKATGEAFDIWMMCKLLTLDVICETTMGVTVEAQTHSDSEYVSAVNEMGQVLYYRALRPWLHPNFTFRFTPSGRRYKKCLEILHNMTNKVIRERREELEKLNAWNTTMDADELGRRRRVAFLDLLLLIARDGSLSDSGIREEVDTFMFEGHDTTASGLAFTLYMLSTHQDVQDKLYEELERVFGGRETLQPTLQELSELKYTEMVIKESLRLYPPVPGISRDITRDYTLPASNLVVPKGTELFSCIMMTHRDPDLYPDPLTFDPERFTAEECARRSPFAYVPFSAGPRNCIGQKFAMLEMKSVIAKTVWNFHIRPDPTYTPILIWELILRTSNGIFIKLEERKR